MGKYRKNLTSFIAFGINLILMGVGFFVIKNNEANKKNQTDYTENTMGGIAVDKNVVENNTSTFPVDENPIADAVTEKPITSDVTLPSKPEPAANITSNTAPAVPTAPSVAQKTTPKSSAKTKTS